MTDEQHPSVEVAVVEPRAVSVQVAPQVQAAELVERLAVIRDAMHQAMERDIDYGVIPGTGSKPTLLKPGAEKLGALFQLDVQICNEKTWHDDGHLTVVSRATVYHQPTGTRLGSGEGICSTRESKYAYRTADRTCPACGAAAIIKGKAEYGGGWLCFRKKGGCGAKYPEGDPAITGQPAGKVANEHLPDAYNTVCKMAAKRARVDAVLAVTGASALFTQDVEDFAPPSHEPDTVPQSEAEAVPPAGPPASAAEQKKLDRLIANLAKLDGGKDWAAIVEKYARREFGHGRDLLTSEELARTVVQLGEHLDALDKAKLAMAAQS